MGTISIGIIGFLVGVGFAACAFALAGVADFGEDEDYPTGTGKER